MTIRSREPLPVQGAYLVREFEKEDVRGYSLPLSGFAFPPWSELLVVSKGDVLRGLHYQKGMRKIVRCLRGKIVDVGVDLRTNSPTYGKHYSQILDSSSLAIVIPDGVAHGIRVYGTWDDTGSFLEPAEVLYHFSAPYNPCLEGAVRWDDPELAIDWRFKDQSDYDNLSTWAGLGRLHEHIILSERDRTAPSFADYKKDPVYR